MSEKELRAALEQIRVLANTALGSGRVERTARRRASRKEEVAVPGKSLSDHLIELREASFFKEPRTAKEAHAKLNSTYRCAPNRVAVALLRLQRTRQLRKTTKREGEKTQIAYVW